MNTAISPFRIITAAEELEDLKQRLKATRYPERETVADWSQGIPLNYVKELVEYWAENYDWHATEARLNRIPQFITELDGLPIHFLHVRSPEPAARPLLLTHGWPGSIVEFLGVIEPLTDPAAYGGDGTDAFHLVCPSLPGYGYSGKPQATGWGIEKIAEQWDLLMKRLGYDGYFAQGGDWGAIVTSAIGMQNRGACRGIHVNMAIAPPDPDTMDDLSGEEEAALASMQYYQQWDSGYAKQQGTRPQTLGYGLVDSPVGQLAWIVEKFYAWTDCNGHPENAISRDRLLDNVMMYWLTASAASSARLYWESINSLPNGGIDLPSAISVFPKEIFRVSERWARQRYRNLKYYNVLNDGGHFAAMEQPKTFVKEVRRAFAAIEKAK